VKIIVIGHVDDREAIPDATDPDAPPIDPAVLSFEMSRARALEVRRALTSRGVASGRIDATGKGAEEPVSDNSTPRGRLRNRRVELRLFVPAR